MIIDLLKKFFWIYKEILFSIEIDRANMIEARVKVSFEKITEQNFHLVSSIRPGQFYFDDFKYMLSLGDEGIFILIDGKAVGYGWLKKKSSKDYFFIISSVYLCRFFVHPDYRGLNLYPCMISYLLKFAKTNGVERAFIAAEHSNIASINGIKKIGFHFIGNLKFYRFCKLTLNKHHLK